MKVLITGGLGGLGQHVCKKVLESGHEAIAFDLQTKITKKLARESPEITVNFGDIMNPDTYVDILRDVDAIIHMAFILPPASETHPKAYDINVIGTKDLIKAVEEINPNIRFVFASSITVFGPTLWAEPPITVARPVNPVDNYSRHKAWCEEAIQNSKLNNWVILRIAEAMYLNISLSPETMSRMYEVPYDQRVEFIHPHDVAIAFTNAAINNKGPKEIFIIGGGESCQMYFHEQLEKILAVFGLPVPDKDKFSTKAFYTDWYDTSRAQEFFEFQTKDFNDYLKDFEENTGRVKDVIRFFAPIAKYFI